MIESPAARQARKPHPAQMFSIGGVAAALVASVIALFATSTATGEYSIVYRVTGSGTAETISYITDGIARPPVSGRQHADVELPWEKHFTLPRNDLGFVSVTAQGDGRGELTVRIEVDELLIKEVTAAGRDRAVATADLAGSPRPG
ncbi:hypothetical protein SAMN05216266_104181 [Amycolatopsis marina]|uniref:Uncharacterized protein n=1 Tax=Amycolatopsis marina TaxID=490629 RepID=A0A1I0Y3U0_9PSEU|nr:hypothetical protein [Amycolatopsis marina]SFB07270.1 hypothetical protein SAMN05216266_104181 [Amycolatopsis marina]